MLATVNALGTTIIPNRVAVIEPGETAWGTPQLGSIGLSVGQKPTAFATRTFLVAVDAVVV